MADGQPSDDGRGKKRKVKAEPKTEPGTQHQTQHESIEGAAEPVSVDGSYDQMVDNLAKQYEKEAEEKGANEVSAAERDAMLGAVMRHVIFKWHQQPEVPIPRSELSDIIRKHTTRHGQASAVICEAQARFVRQCGLHMAEVLRRTKSGDGLKYYVLRSLLPVPLRLQHLRDESADASRGLLLMVLAMIKLNSEKMLEGELWRLLEEAGVSGDASNHPRLGSTKDVLASFVKKRYLIEARVAGPEGEARQYEWGENAFDMFPGATVDAWIKEMCGRGMDTEQEAEHSDE